MLFVFAKLGGSFVLTFDDQLSPETILFLSDNVKEVEAAIAAGMKSLVVDRPGNAVLSEEDKKRFEVVDTFEKISLA
jgi:enolase-phosphatase E1